MVMILYAVAALITSLRSEVNDCSTLPFLSSIRVMYIGFTEKPPAGYILYACIISYNEVSPLPKQMAGTGSMSVSTPTFFRNSTKRLAASLPLLPICFIIYAVAQLRDCASASAMGMVWFEHDAVVAGTGPKPSNICCTSSTGVEGVKPPSLIAIPYNNGLMVLPTWRLV